MLCTLSSNTTKPSVIIRQSLGCTVSIWFPHERSFVCPRIQTSLPHGLHNRNVFDSDGHTVATYIVHIHSPFAYYQSTPSRLRTCDRMCLSVPNIVAWLCIGMALLDLFKCYSKNCAFDVLHVCFNPHSMSCTVVSSACTFQIV